ncbi:MAG: NADH-quinone oxidoreductase subunit C [Deltaproteobacteria bacterium]|jgi:NADH-quinone oxidoreductase subunit C|nr:NADH-quinone oxidoreductase subunit C [Deltaproteobacteria bacterium]
MTSLDGRHAQWKETGALVVSRHDFKTEGLWLSAVVPPKSILTFAKQLCDDGFTLLDVSTIETKEGFFVTYHFDSFQEPGRLALRVLLDPQKPQVPSLYPIYQGAEWHERESFDFFGVEFVDNPNLVPLLLPDDLQGPPPLRKDPKNLASLSLLGVFGKPEILDPQWADIINPPKEPKADA